MKATVEICLQKDVLASDIKPGWPGREVMFFRDVTKIDVVPELAIHHLEGCFTVPSGFSARRVALLPDAA